ncbi:MAG: HNH endonuclease [Halomonas sp.]|nr:HNH endonuclease [Halomonas sp.]
MTTRKPWSDRDRLQALSLYCRLSFGQLHQHHVEIVKLANLMERTPSSVAMKLTNYASLDPEVLALGKKGLPGASQQDKNLWQRFIAEPEQVALECEHAWQQLPSGSSDLISEKTTEAEPTFIGHDVMGWRRHRVGQALFRKAVMIRYDTACVITGLRHEDLLIASHIIPWQVSAQSRLDPANGLCLNALHDRAFDKGLLGIDRQDRIRVSSELDTVSLGSRFEAVLTNFDGQRLALPELIFPNRDYLAWHYRECFRD